MDVVALAQQGIHWAVATLGTATSEDHLKRIFRLVNEVVFCFDGDAAGTQAAARALHTILPLMTDGRHARFLFLPQGEDPDTLVRKEGAGLFEQRVGQALPLAEYMLRYLQQGLDLTLLDDQARLAQAAKPLLSALPSGMLKRRITHHLSKITGMQEQDLLGSGAALQSISQPLSSSPSENRSTDYDRSRNLEVKPVREGQTLPVEEKLLRLLVRYPDQIKQVDQTLQLDPQSSPAASLLVEVLDYLHKTPGATTQVLLAHWMGTPQGEQLLERAKLALELNREAASKEITEISAYLLAKTGEELQQQRYTALLEVSSRGQLTAEEHQELFALALALQNHHKRTGK